MKHITILSLFFSTLLAYPIYADSFSWLENSKDQQVEEWVSDQNTIFAEVVNESEHYLDNRAKVQGILAHQRSLMRGTVLGQHWYTFIWNRRFPKGAWRRTKLDQYISGQEKWETLLDLSTLSRTSHNSIEGISCLPPIFDRCLIKLSNGGADATIIREFDLIAKKFVEDGFYIPEGRSNAHWLSPHKILVEDGVHDTSSSGYPLTLKEVSRGQNFSDALEVFRDDKSYLLTSIIKAQVGQQKVHIVKSYLDFYRKTYTLLSDGSTFKIPQKSSLLGIFKNQVIIKLDVSWKGYPEGSVISFPFQERSNPTSFSLLYAPSSRSSFGKVRFTKSYLSFTSRRHLISYLYKAEFDQKSGWEIQDVPLPGKGSVEFWAEDTINDNIMISYSDEIHPRQISLINLHLLNSKHIKREPEAFSSDDFEVLRYEATSQDGTQIPFSVVLPKLREPKDRMKTILYGYGGFNISLLPQYLGIKGALWLEHGGAYVTANIRGGGEFGPAWHEAAILDNKRKSFEDFIAVAEELIRLGISTPSKLAIEGTSNGGLLVAASAMLRPDLFGAVLSHNPLTDMISYARLSGGNRWIGEYGNPDDPLILNYLRTYSPYHLIDQNVSYPPMLFTTATNDDRVHPAHARKMVAKLQEFGTSAFLSESKDSGHGRGLNPFQRAINIAKNYAFLMIHLGR